MAYACVAGDSGVLQSYWRIGHDMERFHILRFRRSDSVGGRLGCRNVFAEEDGDSPHCRRYPRVFGLHCRLLDYSGASSAQDDRGDQALVFVLHDALGNADLYPLGLQVDTRILIGRSHRIHLPQSLQARDT